MRTTQKTRTQTSSPMHRIGIVGAGAWGTALAVVAARQKKDVVLWAHRREVAATISATHRNDYLAGIDIPSTVRATAALDDLADCEVLFLVTPAQALSDVCAALANTSKKMPPLVICSKGIDEATGGLLSTRVREYAGAQTPVAVLSGPTFAGEVARGLPTAATLACEDVATAARIAAVFAGSNFRPYLSDDVAGVQIGGALKNVIAIAVGMVVGRNLGNNAAAALQTRGLAEIIRFGLAWGARRDTFSGLSGLGDLSLTCNSIQSRNMSLGLALGKGQALADVLAARTSVAEGVPTARVVARLAEEQGIDMPVCQAVHAILVGTLDFDAAMMELLSRPFSQESL